MTSVNAPPDDPLFEKVSSLLTKLTSKASSEAVRSGAAKQLVGSVYEAAAGAVTSTSVTPGSSVGAVLENYSVLENLMAAANYAHADAAGTAARLGAWTAIDQLLLSSCSSSTSSSPSPPPSAAVVKGVLEPVLLPLLGSWMLPRIGAESKAPVRAVALRAAARLVRLAGPVVGAASVLPTLLFHANAAESGSKWPAQQAALVLMRELVASNGCGCEDQLLPLLPSLVPALSDAIHSIQPEVSEAAVETCTLLCVQVIANPDVEKVLPGKYEGEGERREGTKDWALRTGGGGG